MKKYLSITLVLVILVAGSIFLFKERFDRWPWQKKVIIESPSPTPSLSATPNVSTTERDREMAYIVSNIKELSPSNPAKGKEWAIQHFWFVTGSDKDVYVEYTDGKTPQRILLEITQDESGQKFYDVVASFKEGESDWTLKTGVDKQFGKDLELYEEQNGQWVKAVSIINN